MAIPYNNNIPQPTDIPAQSQPQILTNFASIQSIIDVNHADFGAATAGQHNYVEMPVQPAAPAVTIGEVGLYNLLLTGVNEMFVRKSDGTSIPMTKSNQALPGYTYLPSGIILQWAQISANTNPFAVVFPLPFPTSCFVVMTSMVSPSAADPNTFVSVITTTVTNLGFSVNLYKRDAHSTVPSTNPGQFYYLAIGK